MIIVPVFQQQPREFGTISWRQCLDQLEVQRLNVWPGCDRHRRGGSKIQRTTFRSAPAKLGAMSGAKYKYASTATTAMMTIDP